MLKEITAEELMKLAKCDIWVLQNNYLVRLDNCKDVRILVDVVETGKTEPDPPKKRELSAEEKIIKAWNCGERTLKEVMRITGYSYPTVRKYIPISPEG